MKFLRKLFFHASYLKHPPWDTNQTPPEVLEFIKDKPPGKALDLGCGTGTNVLTLVQYGWQAIGVDYIPKAIHTARLKAKKLDESAQFFLSDVTRLVGIEGQFDLILDIGCYQSLSRKRKKIYQQMINERIVPGGYYMIYLFFRPEDSKTSMGASERDLLPFRDFMVQISRSDGTERGIRKSSWLIYRKPKGIGT
jgi:SAM-dependent methyltransferase